jgi:hypothetical protein
MPYEFSDIQTVDPKYLQRFTINQNGLVKTVNDGVCRRHGAESTVRPPVVAQVRGETGVLNSEYMHQLAKLFGCGFCLYNC